MAYYVRSNKTRYNDVFKNDLAMRSWLTEKLNLLNSLQNILTYPGVQEALDEKKLQIHAWYYIIETGEIYEYNFETKTFTLIQDRKNSMKKIIALCFFILCLRSQEIQFIDINISKENAGIYSLVEKYIDTNNQIKEFKKMKIKIQVHLRVF